MEGPHLKHVAILFFSLALAGCQLSKNMDEMHDDTRKMSGRTEQLGKTSDDLKALTSEMYRDMRQGNSAIARDKFLVTLKAARSMAEKYDAAALFIASFEFQLWSSTGEDTPEHRLQLMAEAAQQFMMTVQEFAYSGQVQPEPMAVRADVDGAYLFSAIDDSNNRQQCLNALAAALHFVNPKQEQLVKLKGGEIKPVTLNSMFEDTFKMIGKLRRGEMNETEIPRYAYEIMKFPDVAALVLRARYNTLGFVTTYQVSGLTTESMTFSLSGGANVVRWRWPVVRWNILKHSSLSWLGSRWTFDFDSFLPPQKDEYEKLMKLGIETREVLKQGGYDPMLIPAVKAVMTDFKLSPKQQALFEVQPGQVLTIREERQANFIRMLRDY